MFGEEKRTAREEPLDFGELAVLELDSRVVDFVGEYLDVRSQIKRQPNLN